MSAEVLLSSGFSFFASSANDASLVLRIVHGATRVLLTGDVESTAEATLVRRGALDATIVKVPHHGSRTSSTRGLVAATRPGVAVAMLGAKNRFGFPAREVRERYRDAGALWLQSDRDGAVSAVQLGDRTRAAIKTSSAVGERYLALSPAGSGELTRIPLPRTSVPYDLNTALADVTTDTAELDVEQVFEPTVIALRPGLAARLAFNEM